MDKELTDELGVQIEQGLSLKLLSKSDARKITDLVADRFIEDTSRVWWWEGLKQTPQEIHYGDEVGWDHIPALLKNISQQIYFIPTDDEPNPWPIYSGTCEEVIGLLREMWRFEYILVGRNLDWLVFDTHHNTLVIVGSIATSA